MFAESEWKNFSCGGFNFWVSREFFSDSVAEFLAGVDRNIADSRDVKKDSRTSTVAVCDIPGQGEFIVKRQNCKGAGFILRYMFRRTRVFRATEFTLLLNANGIDTPKVPVAGERRRGRILLAGYQIFEYKKGVRMVSQELAAAKTPETDYRRLLAAAAELIARLHSLKFSHGDCKLQNIYLLDDGSCGVLDLDGGCIHKRPLTVKQALRDLRRLCCSMETCCAARNITLKREDTARIVARAYSSISSLPEHAIEEALRR